jgi:hypothetical protein
LNIDELVEILSRLADGEDVSVETEVTIQAQISVNANRGPGGPIHATIFFKDADGDEVLFSAPIEKMRHVQVGPASSTMEEQPLIVSDLEAIPGIEQREGWTVTGHAY